MKKKRAEKLITAVAAGLLAVMVAAAGPAVYGDIIGNSTSIPGNTTGGNSTSGGNTTGGNSTSGGNTTGGSSTSGGTGTKATKTANPMTVKTKKAAVKFAKLKKKNQKIAAKKIFTITGAQGTVTFKKKSGPKKITISKTGKVTVKKGLKRGTYKLKVNVTAAGTDRYLPVTKTVKVKIRVK